MHKQDFNQWKHTHTFGQDLVRPAEKKTLVVTVLTGITMAVEIVAGLAFGSMALLADGLHMGSHMTALGINLAVYRYARRHANDPRFSFGTGKANALGGFTGAILLATFSAVMAWESVQRLVQPVEIAFNQAILVAVLGLVVNGASVFILNAESSGHHDDHDHDHVGHHHHHHDHNLRSAYLHVLADALTSVLAIAALLAAKYFGVVWVDPLVGILGAVLVANWSLGLIRSSGNVLLDTQGPPDLVEAIVASIESDGDSSVVDLHVWSIGPGLYASIIGVVAQAPLSPEEYKARLPRDKGLVHVSVEACPAAGAGA